ncbi:MAG: tripartite tricarboxylate transporter substrate binding protein [Burkholderiales bacterium]|nr:tripartite tricarboxylate transporter substrate binding protein [Burkholderiales bacterium]
MKHLLLYRLTLSLAVALFVTHAGAQGRVADYPTRPIRVIVPQAAGAGSDIVVRAIVQRIPETWGQALVVDNRAGANGIIGIELAAQAKPDGYTLLYGYTSALTINPSVYKSLPYNTLRDFAPVTQTVANTIALVTHPSLPARNVKELVALTRARPGEIYYGSAGVGNQTHLAAELFLVESGLRMLHVPYKGSTAAITDLLRGQVVLMFTPSAAVTPHIRSGKLRLLATCGAQRATAFPEAPTMVESGFPRTIATGWGGLLAPAGTSSDIIQKLNREFARQLASPGLRERLNSLGSDAVPTTPEEFGALLKSEINKWEAVVKAARLYHTQ